MPRNTKGNGKNDFGNDNPIYAEIGCGKGKFISENAALHPDINFIGIERQTTIMAIAARKTSPEMNNIALIRGGRRDSERYFRSLRAFKDISQFQRSPGLKRDGRSADLPTDIFWICIKNFFPETGKYF